MSVSRDWIASQESISAPELLSLYFRRYFLSFRVLTLIKTVFQLLVCPDWRLFAGIGRRGAGPRAESLGLPGRASLATWTERNSLRAGGQFPPYTLAGLARRPVQPTPGLEQALEVLWLNGTSRSGSG